MECVLDPNPLFPSQAVRFFTELEFILKAILPVRSSERFVWKHPSEHEVLLRQKDLQKVGNVSLERSLYKLRPCWRICPSSHMPDMMAYLVRSSSTDTGIDDIYRLFVCTVRLASKVR